MKTINIFLAGTGLIGSTLLKQISETNTILKKNKKINLCLAGVINSHYMLMQKGGINSLHWKDELEKREQKAEFSLFVAKMKSMRLENKTFIDCTASETVPLYYEKILDAGISIVAANKKSNAGSLQTYKRIKKAEKRNKVTFLYETNVGAGLPVINTIKSMVNTGDVITKIEGVLSGTLSYIFNNFYGERKFSEVIKQAKEKGYTEPDPREDLNGLDFGRKLLILAREIGLDLELDDISIQNLIPKKYEKVQSISDFFSKMRGEDEYFETLKRQAKEDRKVLRYIGFINVKNKRSACSLQMIDNTHPFYSLSGSDNSIAIYSKRYNERPLVIKGPGAGGAVTAGGVFADILSISI